MMGDSAGRSAYHRTGDGAVRRATQRERDGIDPPQLHPLPWLPAPAEKAMAGVAWVALAAILVVLALIAVGVFRG